MTKHSKVVRIAAYALSIVPLVLISFADAQTDKFALKSPLDPSLSTIPGFISAALRVLVVVSLPIISLYVVISGFMFVLARGNSSQLEKAKKNFLYVMLGALLILGASVLSSLLGATVSDVIGN